MKNGTEATSNLSSNLIGSFHSETNFSQKSLLTDTQFSKTCKSFVNDSSVNMGFSKTQLSEMIQSSGLAGFDLIAPYKAILSVPKFLDNKF